MTPATREKIRKAAAAMGYSPNPLLAALASKRFGSEGRPGIPLAYIHSPEPDEAQEITSQVLFGHVQEHARKLGYFLEQFKVGDFRDGKHATQVLFSRGVQGIIVSISFKPEMLPGMDWPRFSVVGHGDRLLEKPHVEHEPFYRTAVDHFGSLVRTWNKTWERGYRRIGFTFFALSPDLMDDQLRWAAAQLCLQRVPSGSRIAPLFLSPDANMHQNIRDLQEWVHRERPDAVVGFNAYVRILLEDGGYLVPQDLAFASLHKGTGLELLETDRDSGMREMRRECFLATVELLDQQIRHHQYGSSHQLRTVVIHPEWLDGDTLPEKS